MNQKLAAWLNAGGIVAPLLWASTVVYSGTRHPDYSALHPTFAARVHNGAGVMYGVTFTLAAGIAAPGDVGLFQRAWLGSLNTWMLVFACRVRVQSRR